MKPENKRVVRVVVLATALSCGLGTVAAMADGNSPVEALFTMLQELQQSIDDLQTDVDALSSTPNVAITPTVIVESGIIDCNIVNVSAEPRHVEIKLMNAVTGTVVATASGTVATDPGRSRGVGAFAPGGFSGTGYCIFTVLDGIKSDVRANLTLTPGTGGDETTSVAVDAQ